MNYILKYLGDSESEMDVVRDLLKENNVTIISETPKMFLLAEESGKLECPAGWQLFPEKIYNLPETKVGL